MDRYQKAVTPEEKQAAWADIFRNATTDQVNKLLEGLAKSGVDISYEGKATQEWRDQLVRQQSAPRLSFGDPYNMTDAATGKPTIGYGEEPVQKGWVREKWDNLKGHVTDAATNPEAALRGQLAAFATMAERMFTPFGVLKDLGLPTPAAMFQKWFTPEDRVGLYHEAIEYSESAQTAGEIAAGFVMGGGPGAGRGFLAALKNVFQVGFKEGISLAREDFSRDFLKDLESAEKTKNAGDIAKVIRGSGLHVMILREQAKTSEAADLIRRLKQLAETKPDSPEYSDWIASVRNLDETIVKFRTTGRETTVTSVDGKTTVTRKITESASRDCRTSTYTMGALGLNLKPCNFGVAIPGMTAIAGSGGREYVADAKVNAMGIVQVTQRARYKPMAFLSGTGYYRWDSEIPFFWGPSVGIGLDKQAATNPPLMAGFSVGLVIDDTKFLALTYGGFVDASTNRIAFPFAEGLPNPITGLTVPSVSKLAENLTITVPLERVRSVYRGFGFSFNYKF